MSDDEETEDQEPQARVYKSERRASAKKPLHLKSAPLEKTKTAHSTEEAINSDPPLSFFPEKQLPAHSRPSLQQKTIYQAFPHQKTIYQEGMRPPPYWDISLCLRYWNKPKWCGKFWFLNYADDLAQRTKPGMPARGSYVHRQNQIFGAWTALRWGFFDRVLCYGRRTLQKDFLEKHGHILNQHYVVGLGLWKAFHVYQTLSQMEEGDILYYLDSGASFYQDPRHYLAILENHDLILCAVDRPVGTHVKRELFEMLNLPPEDQDRKHLCSGFFMVKKNEKTMKWAEAWLDLTSNRNAVSPDHAPPQYPGFRLHLPEDGTLNVTVFQNQHLPEDQRLNIAYFPFETHHRKNLLPPNSSQHQGYGVKFGHLSWHHRRNPKISLFKMADSDCPFDVSPTHPSAWDVSLQPALYPERILLQGTRVFLGSYSHDHRPHDPVFLNNQAFLNLKALQNGVDACFNYGLQDLPADYRERCANILKLPRLAGYGIWRAQIILDMLNKAEDGDVVIYHDANKFPQKDLTPLINLLATNDMVVINNYHTNRPYMKRDCWELLGRPEGELDTLQLQSGYVFTRVSNKTKRFMEEWSKAMEDPRVVMDQPSTLGPEDRRFIEHRHDQSAFTCLVNKNDALPEDNPRRLKIHRAPEPEGSAYFNYHHRNSLREGSLF